MIVIEDKLLHSEIGALQTQHSTSHARRLKRKAKEQIGKGLGDMQTALLDLDDIPASVQLAEVLDTPEIDEKIEEAPAAQSQPRTRQGLIGEGKGAPLSQAQRKRALCVCLSSTALHGLMLTTEKPNKCDCPSFGKIPTLHPILFLPSGHMQQIHSSSIQNPLPKSLASFVLRPYGKPGISYNINAVMYRTTAS